MVGKVVLKSVEMQDCSQRRFSDESFMMCRSEHAEHLGDGGVTRYEYDSMYV